MAAGHAQALANTSIHLLERHNTSRLHVGNPGLDCPQVFQLPQHVHGHLVHLTVHVSGCRCSFAGCIIHCGDSEKGQRKAMRQHELIEVLKSRPFRPFRMYVSDGATYVIGHPDLVWVSLWSAHVGAPDGDRPGPAIERMNIVDLAHITRVEQIEQPTAPETAT
jgi:hypothetical protein